MSMSERLEEKAKKAKDKKATLGTDIELDGYESEAEPHEVIEALEMLPWEVEKAALDVGVSFGDRPQGTFIQMNQSPVYVSSPEEGIEVLDMATALKRHSFLKDYWWKLVQVDADKYTADAGLSPPMGYFIRAKRGKKTRLPIKSCLYLGQERLSQRVHNVIIAEEDSELHVITGCTTPSHVSRGLHLGVSEFYIKKGAHVNFTMIHGWGENVEVRPRTAIHIEEGGSLSNNYICLRPVKSLQTYPTAVLDGKGAAASFNTVIYATRGNIDVGSQVILQSPETSSEAISRVVSTGGEVIARGRMVGKAPDTKAHLECRGLILSDEARIYSIPELDGWCRGLDMSHEAAVGKISQEELEYLMARGLSPDEATSVVVRGFLDVDIKGLPLNMKREIEKITEMENVT